MKQYTVDAFADRVFSGNPAAVCVMQEWPEEQLMQSIAAENNLSETAFVVREPGGWRLRWFTPTEEINLCGHATLAAAFVIMNCLDTQAETVEFDTMSGKLSVAKQGDLYEMDFPVSALREVPVTPEMEQAFGERPVKALLGMDLVCVFDSEETVRGLRPNLSLVAQLPGRIQNVTAPGEEADCATRSFAPKCGIDEDPVCGSAHCQVADYWSRVLGRREIKAYQASQRGGILRCRLTGDGRIRISGRAVLFAESMLFV